MLNFVKHFIKVYKLENDRLVDKMGIFKSIYFLFDFLGIYLLKCPCCNKIGLKTKYESFTVCSIKDAYMVFICDNCGWEYSSREYIKYITDYSCLNKSNIKDWRERLGEHIQRDSKDI